VCVQYIRVYMYVCMYVCVCVCLCVYKRAGKYAGVIKRIKIHMREEMGNGERKKKKSLWDVFLVFGFELLEVYERERERETRKEIGKGFLKEVRRR